MKNLFSSTNFYSDAMYNDTETQKRTITISFTEESYQNQLHCVIQPLEALTGLHQYKSSNFGI